MDEILENQFKIKSPIVKQFITYGVVALIPTLVDFSLLLFLTEWVGFHYMLSLTIAFMVASVVSYFVQKKLTFKNDSSSYLTQFSFFCLIGLSGLAINATIVFGLVEYVGVWYFLGKIIATLITYLWNFGMNRCFTFKKFY